MFRQGQNSYSKPIKIEVSPIGTKYYLIWPVYWQIREMKREY